MTLEAIAGVVILVASRVAGRVARGRLTPSTRNPIQQPLEPGDIHE